MKDKKGTRINNVLENNISRRVFLGTTGKLIGLGTLAHFSMIGQANAADIEAEEAMANCVKAYVCDEKAYTCVGDETHYCRTNQFSCGTNFNCNPVANNTSHDGCIPAHSVTE